MRRVLALGLGETGARVRRAATGLLTAWVAVAVVGGVSPAGATAARAAVPSPVAAGSAAAPPAAAWGIRPALSGLTTLPGGHFTYGLPAGSSISDALVLQNETAAPVTLAVYPADLLASRGGGYAPSQQGQILRGAGAWLRVARSQVTLAGRAVARDAFTLAVPAGTPPGVYRGALVAAGGEGRTPSGVAIQARTALIVHVTVVAHPEPRLEVASLALHPGRAGLGVALAVHNTGNVTLEVQSARIELGNRRAGEGGPAGAAGSSGIALGPPGVYIVPGGRAVLRGSLPGAAAPAGTAMPVVTAAPPGGPPRTYSGGAVSLRPPANRSVSAAAAGAAPGSGRGGTPGGFSVPLEALSAAALLAAAGAVWALVASRRRGRP